MDIFFRDEWSKCRKSFDWLSGRGKISMISLIPEEAVFTGKSAVNNCCLKRKFFM